MGIFSDIIREDKVEMCPEACCGKPITECKCGPDCEHCDCHSKNESINEAPLRKKVTKGDRAPSDITDTGDALIHKGSTRGVNDPFDASGTGHADGIGWTQAELDAADAGFQSALDGQNQIQINRYLADLPLDIAKNISKKYNYGTVTGDDGTRYNPSYDGEYDHVKNPNYGADAMDPETIAKINDPDWRNTYNMNNTKFKNIRPESTNEDEINRLKELAGIKNEGTDGCDDCDWISKETDGDITTCDECAAEKRQTNEAVSEGFKIRDKSRGYGVSDKTYKTREEAKDAAVMKSASSGGDWEVIEETNEAEKRWKQTSMSPQEAIAKYGKENVKVKKGALRNGDDMVEVFVESMNEEIDDDAVQKAIMSSGKEPQDALYDLMSVDGPLGDYVRRSYEITAGENGLHGDDDHEEIFDRMVYDLGLDESYSPGDEMEDGVVSNCCGAPLMDYNDGHGRCSDCKEMAAGETDEEYYESKVIEAREKIAQEESPVIEG